jgi:hypothetical protein
MIDPVGTRILTESKMDEQRSLLLKTLMIIKRQRIAIWTGVMEVFI